MKAIAEFIIKAGIYKATLMHKSSKTVPSYIKELLRNELSFVDWKKEGGAKPVPIMVRLYDDDNTFYTGLSVYIKNLLKNYAQIECEIEYLFNYGHDMDKVIKNVKKYSKFKLRDYQRSAIIKMCSRSFNAISLPTGSGKSLVISMMLVADDVDTVIVVDSKTLMYQLAKDIETNTGVTCGMIGDGIFKPEKWTVAVIDSLLMKSGIDLVRSVKALYFDEVHHVACDTNKRVVDAGRGNILIRRGFSATVYRNDGRGILLPALTGPIVYHKSTSELIDAGWLSRPTIWMPTIHGNITSSYYQAIYNKAIIFNNKRNLIGVHKLFEELEAEHLSVAFFRNVAKHLPILRKLILRKIDKKMIGEISGSTPGPKRIELLNRFRNKDIMLLLLSVGTSGEGFDLPGETEFGVNFCGGSSEIMIRQLLGRILRKPRDPVLNDVNPSVEFRVRYLDFYDDTHRMMRDQSDNRAGVYQSETAFKMHML